MIIGISGKKQTGKNTVVNMIQYITEFPNLTYSEYSKYYNIPIVELYDNGLPYIEKSYAHKLKKFVADIIGCNVEDLEDEAFKNTKLGEEWTRYAYATGSEIVNGEKFRCSTTCTKEEYEEQKRINWQTAYQHELTPRDILQMVGTNVGRIVHRDFHINGLFVDYNIKLYPIAVLKDGSEYEYKSPFIGYVALDKFQKETSTTPGGDEIIGWMERKEEPNWIISDVRFPNERAAIKQRGGIVFRVIRKTDSDDNHPSETAMDNEVWEHNHVIENIGTLEDLYKEVRDKLIINNLIEVENDRKK